MVRNWLKLMGVSINVMKISSMTSKFSGTVHIIYYLYKNSFNIGILK